MNFCEYSNSFCRAVVCSVEPAGWFCVMLQKLIITWRYFCLSSSVKHCSRSMSSGRMIAGAWPPAACWACGWGCASLIVAIESGPPLSRQRPRLGRSREQDFYGAVSMKEFEGISEGAQVKRGFCACEAWECEVWRNERWSAWLPRTRLRGMARAEL